jgi:hypothetical protein
MTAGFQLFPVRIKLRRAPKFMAPSVFRVNPGYRLPQRPLFRRL